jgi:protein CpxP
MNARLSPLVSFSRGTTFVLALALSALTGQLAYAQPHEDPGEIVSEGTDEPRQRPKANRRPIEDRPGPFLQEKRREQWMHRGERGGPRFRRTDEERGPDGPRLHGRGAQVDGNRIAQKLGLSPEQMEKISALRKGRDERHARREEFRNSREHLQDLFNSDKASEQELREQSRKVGEMMQRMHQERLEKMLQLREILSPEQRRGLSELIKKRGRKNMGQRSNAALSERL